MGGHGRNGAIGLVAALALGCAASGTDLLVDLKTDFIPSVDYVGTRVHVLDSSIPVQTRFAFGGDVLTGYRVAELVGVPEGTHLVSVELVDERGLVVHEQRLSVQLTGPTVVTMLATRSCLGVFCADGLTCVGGECLDPRCSEEMAEGCDGVCAEAADCMGEAGECQGFACISDFCFVDVASGCDGEQWCHPDEGCVPRDTAGEPGLTLIVRGQGQIDYGGGQLCGPEQTCEIGGERGTLVTLTAQPATDPFWGWAGADCGDRAAPCEVYLDGAQRVVAVYGPSQRDVDTVMTVDSMGAEQSLRYTGMLALADGSVLVSDAEADRIWRVAPDGAVSSFAGSGVAGYDDGDAASATFVNPSDLTADADGNVYVADNGNNRIRRIDSAGVVTTFAGSGEGVAVDSDALGAGLPSPDYLAWREADRALLVVSGGLRIVDSAGVRTLLEDFSDVEIGVDGDGAVYWSGGGGMYRLPMGATEGELLTANPCDRSGGYSFRLTVGLDGTVVESVGGGWICERRPDGTTRWPILNGGRSDGPDFEARASLSGSALTLAPDGTLFFTDAWPGRILRAIRPR